MKGVLGWVKSHWLAVALIAVAIVSLPAMLIVSSARSAKLQEEVQQDIDSKQRSIQQVSVTYEAPSFDPNQAGPSFTRTPNAATTQAMAEYLKKLERQVRQVEQTAVAHNRAGKRPMVEGLFPQPDPAEATRLRQETGRIWVQAHRDLLREAGAGSPPDPEDVRQRLLVELERVESRLRAEGKDVQSAEAQAEIREALSTLRIGLYRSRANELRFYASNDVFQGVAAPPEGQLPELAQMWDWQHRLWIHEDLIEALVKANTDPVTRVPLPVQEAPVKRLVSVATPAWTYGSAAQTGGGRRGGAGGVDYEMSITGRAGWPNAQNDLYIVRYSFMEVMISSRELPRLIDGISASNFMAVVDIDIQAVDERTQLEQGYFFGGDHVVRVSLVVETLWLKSWLGEIAPPQVRDAMGLPAPPAPEEAESEETEEMEARP